MGEEQRFLEGGLAVADHGIGGDAGQGHELFEGARLEGQRHEGGAGVGDGKAELAGQIIGKAGGAHLGDGLAAGGDDEARRGDAAIADEDVEALGDALDAAHAAAGPDGGAGIAQVVGQHVDDLGGGAIAEELAQGLFVKGDAALPDPLDEHFGRVAGEGGKGEARVLAEEALAPQNMGGVHIGEVAAPAARDADLLARIARMIDDEHLAAAARRLDARHHAGGASAENDHIKVWHGAALVALERDEGGMRCNGGGIKGSGMTRARAGIDSFLFERMRSPAF